MCKHATYTEPDGHGYAICLDCSETLTLTAPYLIFLIDFWESLEPDADPDDCTD